MKILEHIGEYVLLMGRTFRLPDRQRMFWRQYAFELDKQGTQSVPIDLIISIFIGAIMTLQIKLDMANPLLPAQYHAPYAARTREQVLSRYDEMLGSLADAWEE